jgi:SOS response regulatory protein OraA/RecX
LDKVKKGDEKNELVALQKDYALAKRKGIADNRHKTINYLLGKGYRYKDIMKIMTEEKNDEMD